MTLIVDYTPLLHKLRMEGREYLSQREEEQDNKMVYMICIYDAVKFVMPVFLDYKKHDNGVLHDFSHPTDPGNEPYHKWLKEVLFKAAEFSPHVNNLPEIIKASTAFAHHFLSSEYAKNYTDFADYMFDGPKRGAQPSEQTRRSITTLRFTFAQICTGKTEEESVKLYDCASKVMRYLVRQDYDELKPLKTPIQVIN